MTPSHSGGHFNDLALTKKEWSDGFPPTTQSRRQRTTSPAFRFRAAGYFGLSLAACIGMLVSSVPIVFGFSRLLFTAT